VVQRRIPADRVPRAPVAGRFCSHEHLNAWLQRGDRADERRETREAGFEQWDEIRDEAIRALKDAGAIVGLDDLASTLPPGMRRSAAALAGARGHIGAGAVTPLKTVEIPGKTWPLKSLKLVAFAPDDAERYKVWLVDHDDGRLTRFNVTDPEARPFRAVWYQARHKSPAEFGRLAPLIAATDDKRVGRKHGSTKLQFDQQARILAEAGAGATLGEIAMRTGIPKSTVHRFLKKASH
jgi:IclR helix-turn-helix domain